MSNSVLLTKYHTLENKRQQLFADLAKKTIEELKYKQTPNMWSILQATHHVMNAEKLAVEYMGKKIKGINTSPKTGLKTNIRFFLLQISLISSLKF